MIGLLSLMIGKQFAHFSFALHFSTPALKPFNDRLNPIKLIG